MEEFPFADTVKIQFLQEFIFADDKLEVIQREQNLMLQEDIFRRFDFLISKIWFMEFTGCS